MNKFQFHLFSMGFFYLGLIPYLRFSFLIQLHAASFPSPNPAFYDLSHANGYTQQRLLLPNFCTKLPFSVSPYNNPMMLFLGNPVRSSFHVWRLGSQYLVTHIHLPTMFNIIVSQTPSYFSLLARKLNFPLSYLISICQTIIARLTLTWSILFQAISLVFVCVYTRLLSQLCNAYYR